MNSAAFISGLMVGAALACAVVLGFIAFILLLNGMGEREENEENNQ